MTIARTLRVGFIALALACGLARAQTGQLPNNRVLGNVSGATAPAAPLTATQITTLCNAFTSLLPGCVGASGGGTANFLRADGSWAAPPGAAPGGSSGQVQTNNGSGSFAGITNTQLTALLNLATASLPGALPAWPNTTTTYFRGDGSYQTLTANPTASVGAAAINGTATTAMRSDAAPPLANTAVTPGSYTNTNLTVDQQGRITSAANGSGGSVSNPVTLAQGGLGASQSAATANQIPVYPGSAGAAAPTGLSTWLDAVVGTTNCQTFTRSTASTTWTAIQPAVINIECVGVLPGNSATANSTNFAAAIALYPKAQFFAPRDGYSFNATLTLGNSQGITCAYRGDFTVSANFIQTSTATDLFHVNGTHPTMSGCTQAVAGNPTGATGIVIGSTAQKVTTGNSMTSGNATITCTGCFTAGAGEVGKELTAIANTSGSNYIGTIATFVSVNQVTVTPTPAGTASNTTMAWGFPIINVLISDWSVYNFTVGINAVSGTNRHLRNVYVLGADPAVWQNIVWGDQGDDTIDDGSTFVASVAGAHNAFSYQSGGGLKFSGNKVLGQAAITACFEVRWNGQVSSVGPWIIGNSIEGGCIGVDVDGSAAQTASGGIVEANEFTTTNGSFNAQPTTAHPNWTVVGNLMNTQGVQNALVATTMTNIGIVGNNIRNTDGSVNGVGYAFGSAASGYLQNGPNGETFAYQCGAGCTSLRIDDQMGVTLANVPNSSNGSRFYISNADPASSPCTAAGAQTGAFASKQGAALKCQ